DRAGFRVLGNEVLLELAQHPVQDPQGLNSVRGISREVRERRGDELVGAMQAGLAVPDAQLPKIERGPRRSPDPDLDVRIEVLKKERNTLAERLNLAPGV